MIADNSDGQDEVAQWSVVGSYFLQELLLGFYQRDIILVDKTIPLTAYPYLL